jgi:hypothetical protein
VGTAEELEELPDILDTKHSWRARSFTPWRKPEIVTWTYLNDL